MSSVALTKSFILNTLRSNPLNLFKQYSINESINNTNNNSSSSNQSIDSKVSGSLIQNENRPMNFSGAKLVVQNISTLTELPTPMPKQCEVRKYCDSRQIVHSEGWKNIRISVCSKSAMYVDPTSGSYFCPHCKKSGDWHNLVELIDKTESPRLNELVECRANASDTVNAKQQQQQPAATTPITSTKQWIKGINVQAMSQQEFEIILQNSNLSTRFEKKTFEQYKTRVFESKIYAPAVDIYDKLVDVVQLDDLENSSSSLLLSSSSSSNEPTSTTNANADHMSDPSELIIYGLQSLSYNSKEIFVVSDLVDSMAIGQCLQKPSIAIRSIRALTFKVVTMLEKYNKITFWMKDSKLALQLAKHLNMNRCNMLSYARSPYQAFDMNENLTKLVSTETFSMKSLSTVQFKDLKQGVYEQVLHHKKYSGIQWKRFTQLNEILKGHRSGELTILSGPTGSGKTTFLSEYSIDLVTQGVKTLWGSFEIQNTRLARIMMTQYSGLNLYKNVRLFEFMAREFAKLPIYFMNFHGEESLDNVLKVMSNAVLLNDVKHVIIDNLQFMMGSQFTQNFDKFAQQDLIISKCRKFATNYDCHVTIVIHPKKEDSNDMLKISSVFGSAKASQESDNILLIQQIRAASDKDIDENSAGGAQKFLQVSKNRFDGQLGKMYLTFDKEKLCFSSYSNVERGKQRRLVLNDEALLSDVVGESDETSNETTEPPSPSLPRPTRLRL